jgi:hypothetical protein
MNCAEQKLPTERQNAEIAAPSGLRDVTRFQKICNRFTILRWATSPSKISSRRMYTLSDLSDPAANVIFRKHLITG